MKFNSYLSFLRLKIPKQLVYSAGKARLVADVEPVDGGYSLYRTIGNPGDIVSIFETDIAIDKIANVSSHLAYSYNKDVYAYVKDGWIHVRSLNGNKIHNFYQFKLVGLSGLNGLRPTVSSLTINEQDKSELTCHKVKTLTSISLSFLASVTVRK